MILRRRYDVKKKRVTDAAYRVGLAWSRNDDRNDDDGRRKESLAERCEDRTEEDQKVS